MLEGFERQEGTNGGWSGVVVDAQYDPDRLDRRRNRAGILASITPDDVQAAARQYLTGEPVELRIVPKPTEN